MNVLLTIPFVMRIAVAMTLLGATHVHAYQAIQEMDHFVKVMRIDKLGRGEDKGNTQVTH